MPLWATPSHLRMRRIRGCELRTITRLFCKSTCNLPRYTRGRVANPPLHTTKHLLIAATICKIVVQGAGKMPALQVTPSPHRWCEAPPRQNCLSLGAEDEVYEALRQFRPGRVQ